VEPTTTTKKAIDRYNPREREKKQHHAFVISSIYFKNSRVFKRFKED
jgi:hypothetical protein